MSFADLHHFYVNGDPDHACHFDGDADPSFHFDADPDPDSSFQIKAQNLEKVPNKGFYFQGKHRRIQRINSLEHYICFCGPFKHSWIPYMHCRTDALTNRLDLTVSAKLVNREILFYSTK
jgi:hypothetical protein